jgi:hypothetical protein
VIALNGIEQPLAEAIGPVAPRSSSAGVCGVWVLRPSDVGPVLQETGALV